MGNGFCTDDFTGWPRTRTGEFIRHVGI